MGSLQYQVSARTIEHYTRLYFPSTKQKGQTTVTGILGVHQQKNQPHQSCQTSDNLNVHHQEECLNTEHYAKKRIIISKKNCRLDSVNWNNVLPTIHIHHNSLSIEVKNPKKDPCRDTQEGRGECQDAEKQKNIKEDEEQ